MIQVSLLYVMLSGFVFSQCKGEAMIGPGGWMVEDIIQCDDIDQYEMTVEVTRNKLNRTHDGFTIYVEFDKDFTESLGIEIDMYKMVDGGYKYYQYLADESACKFVKKYAEENFVTLLSLANIDPPDCPIKAGAYTAKDFVYNYEELKTPSPYGSYEIYSYLTLAGKRLSCVKLYASFEQRDDDDE